MTLAGILTAPSIRTLSRDEVQDLRNLVVTLHGDGVEPEDIADRVGFHEEWCRRAISRWQAPDAAISKRAAE